MNDHPLWYLAVCARAAESWFQSAHHVASGSGFSADHERLYGRIYEGLGYTVDSLIERALSLSNDVGVADPKAILTGALTKLDQWPAPATLAPNDLATAALTVNAALVESTRQATDALKVAGNLSQGTENLLAGIADSHERYAYQLGRRSTRVMLRPPTSAP